MLVMLLKVCVGVVVLYIGSVYLLAAMINHYGPGSVLLLTSPRTAYTIWFGPRSMNWEGLHIQVDRQFVLRRTGTSVVANRIERELPIIGPGVVFVEPRRATAPAFASEAAWCASAPDRCAVRPPVPAGGQAVCLAIPRHTHKRLDGRHLGLALPTSKRD